MLKSTCGMDVAGMRLHGCGMTNMQCAPLTAHQALPIRTAIRMLRFHACCTRVRMPHAHAHSARLHKRACELPMLRICVLVSFQAFVQVCKEEAGSAREGGGREGMRERRVWGV